MKKLTYYVLFILLIISSCSNDDLVNSDQFTNTSTDINTGTTKNTSNKPLMISNDLTYVLNTGGGGSTPANSFQYKVGGTMMFDQINNKVLDFSSVLEINGNIQSNYWEKILSWNQSQWNQKPVGNTSQITISFEGHYFCPSGNSRKVELEFVYDPITNTSRAKRPNPVAMDEDICY
ncbi:MAG: hypothetical protein LBS20_20060 [Prevotella sp.]|jgi:hypothetical protein|nr:hypothetical protein [Prevotella sp.]